MSINVSKTGLEGVVIVDTEFFRDERGFFIESYHRRRFEEHGLRYTFIQDNHSRSGRNVLRGFHYQDMSEPMGKLVRCTVGRILDVALDLRIGSPTFGRWEAVELSAENMRQLMVPAGFGHAFLTLSDFAEVHYKCTGYYAMPSEGTIVWNDPDVAMDWPIADPVLSKRDSSGTSLQQYLTKPAFTYEAATRCGR